MTAQDSVQVEVVYATPELQLLRSLRLAPGATVADALAAVAADPQFAAIELNEQAVGIFGRLCQPSQPLASGDRVEIYRELALDAKTARQRRAEKQKNAT